MKINLTVDVESREDLAEILQAGREHTLLDCRVIDCRVINFPATLPPPVYDVKTVSDLGINAAHRERLVTDDYWRAPAGEGPQAATWKDKPHRLVYDCIGEIERLRALLPPGT